MVQGAGWRRECGASFVRRLEPAEGRVCQLQWTQRRSVAETLRTLSCCYLFVGFLRLRDSAPLRPLTFAEPNNDPDA